MLVAEEVVPGLVGGGSARGAASFSVSDNGVLAYATTPETALWAGMVRSGRPTSWHRWTDPLCELFWRGALARRNAARDVRSGHRFEMPTSGSSIWRADNRPSSRSVQGQTVVPSGHPIVNGWHSRRNARKEWAST